jgi:hypothetical protein
MTPFIRLSRRRTDARSQLVGGTTAESIQVKGLIPPGHKVATRAIATGEPVRRYNQIIGFATKPIAAGEHVHTHNLGVGDNGGDFARDYAYGADVKPAPASGSHLHGHQARRRPRGHAQLHRHPVQRQLLGHRRAGHCRPLLAPDQPGALADFPMSTAWWR